jgi:hypothetical protein
MSKSHVGMIFIAFLLLLVFPAASRAQKHEDFDQYKIRFEAGWFYSSPSGNIQGTATVDTRPVDLQKDLGFSSYSTFSGKVDWKFTRKNHFYLVAGPFYSSKQRTLTQEFHFQGKDFIANAVVQTELHALVIAPGYQYDIIRRKRGHLGLGVQMDLFETSAKISAAAQVINTTPPTNYGPVSASGSFLAPIPVAGPEFRLYLTNSPKLFVEGNVYGMYFAGYGNFVSTSDALGVTLTKHISVDIGYQLGSRLTVNNNNSSNRFGVRMTQQGAIAGLGFSF